MEHSMSQYVNKAEMLKEVMAENEQLRAQLAAAQQGVQVARITIDFKQATELLEMFGGEPTEYTLTHGQGHSGCGLYAHSSEYPEDGAIYLGESDAEAVPAAPAHPAEGVPAQAVQPVGWLITKSKLPGDMEFTQDPMRENKARSFGYQTQALYDQPAAQGMDAIRALIAQHSKELEHNHYAYFELAYTRQTGWMVWITDKPAFRESELINPYRKVLWQGQGDTPDEACENAALAAQSKQGGEENG